MPVVEGTADKTATQYPSGDRKQLGEALTHESVPVEPAAASRALRSLCSRRRMGSPSRDSSRSVARSFWAYFRISILRDIGGKVANFARVPELYAVVSSSSGSSCNSNRSNSRCSMIRRGLFGYPWAFIHSSKGIPWDPRHGIQTTRVMYSLRQRIAERRRDALVLYVIARLHIFMRLSASAIRIPVTVEILLTVATSTLLPRPSRSGLTIPKPTLRHNAYCGGLRIIC